MLRPSTRHSDDSAAPEIFDSSILLIAEEASAPWDGLARRGYRLVRAAGAAEAIDAYARNPDISVVIIDLELAGCDGLALVETLRERDAKRDWTEFLLVAGQDALPAAVRAVKLQVSDFLVKPLSGEDFATAVSEAYNLARMNRFKREEERTLETSLNEFKMRTNAAISQLIARAHDVRGRMAAPSEPALSAAERADHAALQSFVAGEYERARLREKIFGPLASNHSAWMLLLVLSDSLLAGQELTIKSAAYSAGLPLSSALRKINEMCACGLVTRRGDPADARRSFVALTPQGRAQFSLFLAEAGKSRDVRQAAGPH